MKCPHCQKEINPAAMLGSMTSERKAESSRRNGKLGGRRKIKPPTLLTPEDLDALICPPPPTKPARRYTPAEQAEIDRNQAEQSRRLKAYGCISQPEPQAPKAGP